MKALLIAGGFGTRLRPLTFTRPKHLLPIANQPHLYRVFDLLQRHEVTEVVLLTSYLAETFEPCVEEAERRGLRIAVAHEDEPLGTAGALKNAERHVDDEPFFAFNGDVLTSVNLSEVRRRHEQRQAELTIVLTPVEDPSAFGVVPMDEEDRVLGFIEKPPPGEAPTNLINAGIYLFEPGVFGRIPAGEVVSAERELFPGMIADGAAVFGHPTDAYWMDIGTPQKYLQANLDALAGAFPTEEVAPGGATVLQAEGAELAEDAELNQVIAGTESRVLQGAVVDRSVLLPRAVIGEGARVRDCILGEGAAIAQGVTLQGATLADGERVDRAD